MNKLLITIALLMLGTSAYTGEPSGRMDPLKFSCSVMRIDCTDITPPTIVYTRIMGAYGLYGAYVKGESMVFIDPDAPDHTVVHEVTHYVLYEAGLNVSRCVGEELARKVASRRSGLQYNDDWKVRYSCKIQ